MSNEIQQYTIDLSSAGSSPVEEGNVLRSGLEKLGYGENHIFSVFDADGPNGSRDPPANYIMQPSEKPIPRTEFKLRNGNPCTREQKGREVDECVKRMRNQTNELGEATFYDWEIREERGNHPGAEDKMRMDYFNSRVNVFDGRSLGHSFASTDTYNSVSVWDKGNLDIVNGHPDYDPAEIMYQAKNKGVIPVAIIDLNRLKGSGSPEIGSPVDSLVESCHR